MYPYGQPFRPPMAPGMVPGFGFPPGVGSVGVPPGTPGIPPPPGLPLAPGVVPPPGVQMAQANLPTRPGMPGFVPPANLPNINFNAPIIRLGTSNARSSSISNEGRGGGGTGSGGSGAKGGESGKGSGSGGINFVRGGTDSEALVPPTQEEGLKTIFVGGIPKDLGDEWIERILKAVARLRRWVRATDEEGRPCKFGFAEYEDVVGLECAIEILKDIEVPAVDDRKETVKLLTSPDENALAYINKYYENIEVDEIAKNSTIEKARAEVKAILLEYGDPTKRAARSAEPASSTDAAEGTPDNAANAAKKDDNGPQPEIVTIPLSTDDELSDIPADMREMVAKEIAAFRERSNRRDMERLKREEEVERMERERNNGVRVSRLASPPTSAPTGPSGGANSIPIGPSRLRDAPASAPTAPRMAHGGVQIQRDYQKGVTFVNGSTANSYWTKEEEESDASDEELERRRKEKKARELESAFLDHERRWLNRERSRTMALEREQIRDKDDEARVAAEKQAMAKRLAEWDDDVEASKKLEDYYVDRSLWIRNRTAFRTREIEMDERDKAAEARQLEQEKKHAAESMADSFLARQAEELEKTQQLREQQAQQPQKFKLSLGAAAAAKKAAAEATPTRTRMRKTAAEVEGLLEDEEEDASKVKRVLVPIQYDASADIIVLDEETREQLARQLAQEIPSDRKGLFEWKVQWDHVDEAMVKEKLQPFVEKKIVEYLGVQEQDLINFVLEHIRKRGSAEDLVKELEMALDEDAEVMVKKVWRMVIFYSESEKRGLS
ncbi:hypothetical protein BDZ91DRAFT_730569 [Kalaharituber pfeilii]|nr:hypothetical protein BDZ91DRAFT_730569 [Kalaharituber pfeilii]